VKIRHRYISPIITFLIVYIFGLWIQGVSTVIVNGAYTYLNHLLPGVFPVYNVIYEQQAYEQLQKRLTVVCIFLTLFFINLIAMKIDNKKYERMIVLTDGQYLIKDGVKLYLSEFFKSDLIVSALVPALLVIPSYYLSQKAMEYFGLIIPTWLGYTLKQSFGIVKAVTMASLFSFIGRMLSIPTSVKSWRASWLSDI
jgi:hypothetical protein